MARRFVTPPALLVAALLASAASAADRSADIAAPQSPAKPAPEGLRYVDQGRFDPRLKGYELPEGFRLEVVATEPQVVNPVGMTFDTSGTLYVLEWRPQEGANFPEFMETFTFKDGTTRKIATMKKAVRDVLNVLSFNKEKGVYDKAALVLEDELPSSVLVHEGWIYLSGRGSVRRYRRSKPGGPYDVREVIAQGFCGFHHHQVSGLTIGNDGWLYITSGDDDNFPEGSDGSRATVLRTGAVFRCRPDGTGLHTFSLGYRNPYRDLAFDEGMNLFHVDNDNEDGSKFTGCRIMHVAEEADFGWRLFPGARCCRPDMLRGAVLGEMPGKLPAMLKTGRGSPAGLLIYNDTQLPEAYRGLLYYPDVFRRVVRAYRTKPAGSTFEVTEEFEFLRAPADPLFRPCQMVTGPDGAIYVCDWRTDSGGAGKLWGDGKHGMLFRIRWAGGRPIGSDEEVAEIPLRPMDSWAKVAALDEAGLVAALKGPNLSERLVAQATLRQRGEAGRPALLALLADRESPAIARIAALGVLNRFYDASVQTAFLSSLDGDPAPDIRRLAAEGLALNAKPGDAVVVEALNRALAEPSLAARRAVALALGKLGGRPAAGALVNLYRADDNTDVYYSDGLLRAIERTGAEGVGELIALLNSGDQGLYARVVGAFLAGRSPAMAAAIPKLLANPHLSDEQRASVIRTYPNYQFEPPLSLEPLADYLVSNPGLAPVVQLAALDALAATGGLAGGKATDFLKALVAGDSPDLRRAACKAAAQNGLRAVSPALVALVADGKAGEIDRRVALDCLVTLGDRSAVPALQAVVGNRAKEPTPLVVESLRALGRLDPNAAEAAATAALDGGAPELWREAVDLLGATPRGAKAVAARFAAGKLPPETLPAVTESLRKHARDPEVAAALAEVMRGGLKLSIAPDQIERTRKLVAEKGDAGRGRALYLDAKRLACVSCHQMEGVGGQVGPVLNRLWETHTLEKIMESIVEPNREIKEGYQSYVLETKAGQVYTGLKTVDTPQEVVIREATGRDVRVARGDIEELAQSKVSLMPDNATAQLSYGEFIDLMAFLKSREAQESLRGLALDFWVSGKYDANPSATHPPEAADPRGVKGVEWKPVAAEPDGFLNLEGVFGKTPGMSSYALTYVYSPKAQRVAFLVGSDDAVRVWVGGKLVHQAIVARSPKPDQDRFEAEVPAGWTPVLCRVINGAEGQGLYLRVSGGEGVRVSREAK